MRVQPVRRRKLGIEQLEDRRLLEGGSLEIQVLNHQGESIPGFRYDYNALIDNWHDELYERANPDAEFAALDLTRRSTAVRSLTIHTSISWRSLAEYQLRYIRGPTWWLALSSRKIRSLLTSNRVRTESNGQLRFRLTTTRSFSISKLGPRSICSLKETLTAYGASSLVFKSEKELLRTTRGTRFLVKERSTHMLRKARQTKCWSVS